MAKMKTILVSVPYVYPLCPLNFNHAKMFVVADVFARFLSSQNNVDCQLIFPIASHYSGNTAQSTSRVFCEYFSGDRNDYNSQVFNLYKNIYKTPSSIIRKFVNPTYLMDYFNAEIINELRVLGVSCDFKDAYTTRNPFFGEFVMAIFRQYKRCGVLVKNTNQELAINYDDLEWRNNTISLIKNTNIKQDSQRQHILSALNTLSSNWECLRHNGYGVAFDASGLIIDPMFDSELFMVFDLFIYWKNRLQTTISSAKVFFDTLFESLKNNTLEETPLLSYDERNLITSILNSLPCTLFFAEEHLKNWLSKKFFAEEILLHPELRTTTYRILGMGMLAGKRMSASRGHAILTRTLIKEYGGTITRLVILLSGGNISKKYNYDVNLPEVATRMLDTFSDYLLFLQSNYQEGTQTFDNIHYETIIDKLINEGYLRQAVIELLVNIPSYYKDPSPESISRLLSFFNKYITIFLPEYAKCHC